MSEIETKQCRRCKEVKPVDQMKRDNRNGDNYSSFCKACHADSTIAWQKANRDRLNASRRLLYAKKKEAIQEQRKALYDTEKARWERRWHLYKATREWFEATLAAQGGGCAICGAEPSKQKRSMAIDHDHACCSTTPTCGKCNRGILCHSCNTSLHVVEEKDDWLERATSYLTKHKRS